MLDLQQLQKLITANQLPAEIVEFGRTWVRFELTDEHTLLTETRVMGTSDFVDLILHWREHGCHERPCPAMTAGADHVHDAGDLRMSAPPKVASRLP